MLPLETISVNLHYQFSRHSNCLCLKDLNMCNNYFTSGIVHDFFYFKASKTTKLFFMIN